MAVSLAHQIATYATLFTCPFAVKWGHLRQYLGPLAANKMPKLGALKNRTLFLTILEARSPRSRVTADVGPYESSYPGLQTTVFSLCPHTVQK